MEDKFQIGDIVKIKENIRASDLLIGEVDLQLVQGQKGTIIKINSFEEQKNLKYLLYMGENKGFHDGEGLKEYRSCVRVPEDCLELIKSFSLTKDEDTVLITQQMESM